MERKIVQDVVPRETKSIRKIPPSTFREVKINRVITPPPKPPRPKGKSRLGVWLVALLCIIFLIFSVTLLFSSAIVRVKPKQQTTSISGSYTANKNAKAGELRFDIMTIEKEGAEAISATTAKTVSAKARGQIVVYNIYSGAPQVLAANTRFQSSTGKIYRIQTPITVPGKTTKDGKDIPGSVTATVYANEPGAEYNMSLSDLSGDFTIAGFAGTPKAKAFYGRLKTAITGGASGDALGADEKALSDARERIRSALKTTVLKEAFAQKPDGFVLFDNGFSIKYESLPLENAETGKVMVREKAILYGIIFNKKALAAAIAPSLAADIAKDAVVPENLENLQFTIQNAAQFDPTTSQILSFALKGPLKMTWQFSDQKLKADLAGKSAKSIPVILRNYPGIDSADITLKPFWKRSFPADESKITIEHLTP